MVPPAQRKTQAAQESAKAAKRASSAKKAARNTAKKASKKTTQKGAKKSPGKPAPKATKKAAKKTNNKTNHKLAGKASAKPEASTQEIPRPSCRDANGQPDARIQRAAKWKTTENVARTSTRGGGSKGAPKPVSKPPKLDMNADVMDFIAAVDAYKAEYHRPFPGWSEILFVLKKMGYKKPRS